MNPESEKYKKMVDWIAKDLGVNSLKYLKLDDMISAIGVAKEKICTYCWTGKSIQMQLNRYQQEVYNECLTHR